MEAIVPALLVTIFLLALVGSQDRLSLGSPTRIVLNKGRASIPVGGTEKLVAMVTPSQTETQTVTWFSSDPLVASVSSEGTISGVVPGVAYVVAAAKRGGKNAICEVTVQQLA